MKLPKEIFCRIVTDDEPWLNAEASLDQAMGDHTEPVDIGVYRLVEIARVARPIQVVKKVRVR